MILGGHFDFPNKKEECKKLEQQLSDESIYNNLDEYTKLRNGRNFSYDNIKIEESKSTFNTSIGKIIEQHKELVTLAALKNNTTFEEEFEKCKDYKYAEKIANYFNGVKNEIE